MLCIILNFSYQVSASFHVFTDHLKFLFYKLPVQILLSHSHFHLSNMWEFCLPGTLNFYLSWSSKYSFLLYCLSQDSAVKYINVKIYVDFFFFTIYVFFAKGRLFSSLAVSGYPALLVPSKHFLP